MKKKTFYSETAYIIGLIILALGTAFMERADFGLSMVVAPAYILHLKVSQYLPFFTFGMAEYAFQAILLVFMMLLLRRVKISYPFSFVTTIIYGVALDTAIGLITYIPTDTLVIRSILYVVGLPLCSLGVAFLFHTYIPPAAYELFVKEVSGKFGFDIHKFKTFYDCVSCFVSIVLSFVFFGLWHFEGIKLGTVICALLNGYFIQLFTKFMNKKLEFANYYRNQKYFK